MRDGPLTAARLHELFNYDPATGVFTNKKWRGGTARTGTIAGSPNELGYLKIAVDGIAYRAHRLAWLYVYSEWPPPVLDHIDDNPANNAISNLRPATYAQNVANGRRPKNSTSGFKGVSKTGRKWAAYIHHNRKKIWLGSFPTITEALAAHASAADKLYGEFARQQTMTYDAKCYDLADLFLGDKPHLNTDKRRDRLATVIQTTIEEWIKAEDDTYEPPDSPGWEGGFAENH